MDIARIEASDRAEIQELYEQNLNSGSGITTYFDALFCKTQRIGLKGVLNGQIMAVFLCSEGIDFTVPHLSLQKSIQNRIGLDSLYTVDIIYTDPAYRHNGIQTRLSSMVISELSLRNVRWLLFEHWIKRGQEAPDFGLLGTEYLDLGNYPKFYQEIRNHGIWCPICGENCVCGAKIILYKINLVPNQSR